MILTRRALSTATIGMAMAVTLVLIPSTANATEPDSGSAALTASKGAVLNLDGASDHVADLPAVPEVETRELATIALASGLGNAGHEFDVAKATGVTTTTSIKPSEFR